MSSVFHKGEIEVQTKMGSRQKSEAIGQMMTDKIITGAYVFIENQNTIIVSSKDVNHKVWVSMLIGKPGFLKVINQNIFSINTLDVLSNLEDVFFKNIKINSNIGSLFIELNSRRRYRINGTIISINKHTILVKVTEAYPNCPKYIQQRAIVNIKNNSQKLNITKGINLNTSLQQTIVNADTFFVGSTSLNNKMDASHRGGLPGFIEVINSNTLKIPDYSGNYLYNTLGNFIQNPNGGLLFINFKEQQTLQLNGRVTLLFNQNNEEDKIKTMNTGVYWTFEVTEWILTENKHPIHWEFNSYSKFNPILP